MKPIKISALSLLLLASFGAQAAPADCAPVKKSNGIVTFGKTGIKMLDAEQALSWGDSVAIIRSFCTTDCAQQLGGQVWRIPSKADMEIIGKCLDPKLKYWTSERFEPSKTMSASVGAPLRVYAYQNGTFIEENGWARGGSYWHERVVGIGITGGPSAEHSAFARIADEVIVQLNDLYRSRNQPLSLSRTINLHIEGIRDRLGAEAAAAQKVAQQAQLLGGQPKGTIWNCMSEVVPVNMSINRVGFSCPNGSAMDMTLMQKYKWKITSTERIRAQAEDYRTDAYGMSNWNGSGVIISLMLEKQ